MSADESVPDVYESDRAAYHLARDREPYRVSLYTNIKDDHPDLFVTDGPCDCESGGDGWTRNGAMSVKFPQQDLEAG